MTNEPVSQNTKFETLDGCKLTAFIVFAALLFLLPIGLGLVLHFGYNKTFSTFGEFGDFVGGLANPALALMGYLALLYTIVLQQRELGLSRKELELTRLELSKSSLALESQAQGLEQQNLSRSFFDIFGMYKSCTAEISYGGQQKIFGKMALERISYSYKANLMDSNAWDVEKVRHHDFTRHFGLESYFRLIYRLLKYFDSFGSDGEFYVDLFRAQLTTPELQLLFLNCLTETGQPMIVYAERFQLFDNMEILPGLNLSELVGQLDPSAFGKNDSLLALYAA
jgi:Putative phage abortive infection protein